MTVSANLPPPVWVCTTGNVSRLNYGNSKDMEGIIAPTGASSVTLIFSEFNTELAFDKLSVLSCTTSDCSHTSILLDAHYGPVAPSPVTSSTGITLIMWHSDASSTRSGWSATWNVGGILAVHFPCPLAFDDHSRPGLLALSSLLFPSNPEIMSSPLILLLHFLL